MRKGKLDDVAVITFVSGQKVRGHVQWEYFYIVGTRLYHVRLNLSKELFYFDRK